MRVARIGSRLILGVAMAIAATGCGGTATLVDPQAVDNARQMKEASPAPVAIQTPTPAPTATPIPMDAKILATVKNFKRPLLGLGKSTVEVDLVNPTNFSLSGTLKVTFLKSSETTSDRVQTQNISMQPNSQQTLTFTCTTWLMSSAKGEIVMSNGGFDPHGAGAGTGYNTPGSY